MDSIQTIDFRYSVACGNVPASAGERPDIQTIRTMPGRAARARAGDVRPGLERAEAMKDHILGDGAFDWRGVLYRPILRSDETGGEAASGLIVSRGEQVDGKQEQER